MQIKKNKIDACPCIDCLCKPICKNKHFVKLIDCSILDNYLYNPNDIPHIEELFIDRVKNISKSLELDPETILDLELRNLISIMNASK